MNRPRIAVTGAYVTNGFVVGAFVARIPDFKSALGISNSQLGTAIFCSSIGLIVGLAPTARICAKSYFLVNHAEGVRALRPLKFIAASHAGVDHRRTRARQRTCDRESPPRRL